MTSTSGQSPAGPASMVGVAIGLMLAGTPAMTGQWWSQTAWLLTCVAPPLVGLLLLLVPGVARRLGVGLVASALAIPVFVLSWPFAAIVFG